MVSFHEWTIRSELNILTLNTALVWFSLITYTNLASIWKIKSSLSQCTTLFRPLGLILLAYQIGLNISFPESQCHMILQSTWYDIYNFRTKSKFFSRWEFEGPDIPKNAKSFGWKQSVVNYLIHICYRKFISVRNNDWSRDLLLDSLWAFLLGYQSNTFYNYAIVNDSEIQWNIIGTF